MANGLRIGDGGEFENVSPTFAQMLNRNTNVEFATVSPTNANTMLAVRAFLSLFVNKFNYTFSKFFWLFSPLPINNRPIPIIAI
jgi:hypothetical protein